MRRNPKQPAPRILLGIESATPNGGMALVTEERCLGSFTRWGGRLHSQRMMTGLRDLMRDLGIEPSDLTAVAVSVGPGSFTGVRVGLAAAKTIAHSLQIPILGIPTLEAFALRVLGVDSQGRLSPDLTICPILDARRGEVYTAAFDVLFEPTSESNAEPESPIHLPGLRRLVPDVMMKTEVVAEALLDLKPDSRQFLVCGEGAYRAKDTLQTVLGNRLRIVPPHRMEPGPEEIAWMGLRRWLRGDVDDPMTLMPVYLREPDVQFPRTLQNQRPV